MQTFIVMVMWVFIWLMEKRDCEKWKRKALWYENEYLRLLQMQADCENKQPSTKACKRFEPKSGQTDCQWK